MQYFKYAEGDYQYRTDPDTGLLARFGQRDHKWVTDAELSSGGFALAEDAGWVNIDANDYVVVTGGYVREGMRSDYYVVDAEMTVAGFSGSEGTNWCNINGAY